MVAASPRLRIAAECERRGRAAVVAGCVAALQGGEPDSSLLLALGGPPARVMLSGDSRADVALWSRVWGVRGLLWALDDATATSATDAVVAALRDDAWRVREKAAQVCARHLIDEAVEVLVVLRDNDPVARVRLAAGRALRRLTVANA